MLEDQDRDRCVAMAAQECQRILKSCTKLSRCLAALGADADVEDINALRLKVQTIGTARFALAKAKKTKAKVKHPLTDIFAQTWAEVFPENVIFSPNDWVSVAKMLPALTLRYPQAGKALLKQAMQNFKNSTASWIKTPRSAWQLCYHMANGTFVTEPEQEKKKRKTVLDLTDGSTGTSVDKSAKVPGLHGVGFQPIEGLDYLPE